MSERRRGLGGWMVGLWILLVVPVALAVGWGIGQLQAPLPPAAPLTVAARGVASDRSEPVAAPPRVVVSEGHSAASPAPGTSGPAVELAAPQPARAPEPPPGERSQWTTFESALDESRRNGKPILVDFSADWCPPCQRMKRDVFDDPTHGDAVRTAVIPVAIVDRVRETGSNPPAIEDLQRRYQVNAFPTLVVFSPATGREVKTRGYGGAEATVRWIDQAARAVR